VDIEFQHLSFEYRSAISGNYTALNDISLKIPSQEIMAVVGATGSGKTTLIQHLNGLLKPTSGNILVNGFDLSGPDIDTHEIRRKIGLVFQFPENQLFEETVFKEIAYGLKNSDIDSNEIERRIRKSLALVGLDFDTFHTLSPFHLSGGEKRKVAIASILVMDPQVLVLDEPTVGLDWNGARKIEDIILQYHLKGKTIVFVSHDMDLVARIASRIVVLDKGRIRYKGDKSSFFCNQSLIFELGLKVPHIKQFLMALQLKGLKINTNLSSISEAKRELQRVFHLDN
jgi:energy-coupling factor transport system ATP-binding protein